MADIRARARKTRISCINQSGEFELSQTELFRTLSGELGVSFEAMLRKFNDYHFERLDVMTGLFIKAHFVHTRYGIGRRRDKIATDRVAIVWEWKAGEMKWVQLGVNREPIEMRTHFHNPAGFDNAVEMLEIDQLADELSAELAK